MCVCVCVCIYIYIYVCIGNCVCVCVCRGLCVCVCVWIERETEGAPFVYFWGVEYSQRAYDNTKDQIRDITDVISCTSCCR